MKSSLIIAKNRKYFFKNLKYLLLIYGSAILFVGLLCVIGLNLGMPLEQLTQDPVAILNGHPFMGVLSNIGILCWSTAFSICLFCYFIYRRYHFPKKMADFFLWSSGFTLMLVLDDLFLLHESIPGSVDLLVYFLIFVLYLKRFTKVLFHQDSFLFWVSILFFALSVTYDMAHDFFRLGNGIFVEDIFKFFGIFSWAAFFWQFSLRELKKVLMRSLKFS